MKHDLKTWPEYYIRLVTGQKTFEIRKNDRNFMINDLLWLREWDNEKQEYTGRTMHRKVTYVLNGGQFGIEEGYCVMSIEPLD